MTLEDGMNYAGGLVPRLLANMDPFRDKAIYFTGRGPYESEDLMILLTPGIVSGNLENDRPDKYTDPKTAFVIVGYENYNEDEILRYITEIEAASFLPQEGFLDLLLGHDWWNDPRFFPSIDYYLAFHDGLKFVKSLERERFQWPSTQATQSIGTGDGDGSYMDQTNLNAYGYSIWHKGKRRKDSERWAILKGIIERDLLTLQEVAETIASHCKRYKREGRNSGAIERYELDLERMKKTYYNNGTKGFRWPSTR